MQRNLASHNWPIEDTVRVRMGIDAGEAIEASTGLVGADLHRAARIAASGHGGQVVLSETVAALVQDHLPADAGIKDLGLHRLKDLGRPHRLFQLEAGGLRHDFPPLRSLENPELPNNLPSHLSSFVGREEEMFEIKELVRSHRLVTLAGAGGCGKTRLALQVAAELLGETPEGVFFVDLAPVGTPGDVPAAIHSALRLPEPGGRPVLDVLLDALESQRVLVVLDNCEHVIDASAQVAEQIEQRSRFARLLATSREPLGIEGERVFRLRPLSLPPEGARTAVDLASFDAIALFLERVRVHEGFVLDDLNAPLVAALCRRLDGVPFALELAAARLGSMSLADLYGRLDQRFRLLTGGSRTALARQRTLQAMVDWSYDLLSPSEQSVLDRLSVFVGSFDLEAAEAVCAPGMGAPGEVADALGSLVDKSLVVTERTSFDLRYRLLETIRQYGADKLADSGSDHVESIHRLHAEHFLAVAESAAPNLRGGPQQWYWHRRLSADWNNLRTAIDWFDAQPAMQEGILRIIGAVYLYLLLHNSPDLLPILSRSLDRYPERDAVRGRALVAASWMTGDVGQHSRVDMQAACVLAESAVELARESQDRRLLALALGLRALEGYLLEEPEWSDHWEEAVEVARGTGDPWTIGRALWANFRRGTGEDIERHQEALECFRQADDSVGMVQELSQLASARLWAGDLVGAMAYEEEALETGRQLDSSLFAGGTANLATLSLLLGDPDRAEPLARSALIAARQRGRLSLGLWPLFVLACCCTERGELDRAARLTGAHDEHESRDAAASPAGLATWSPPEQARRDSNREQLRQRLGEEAFGRAYERGRSISLEEAYDLALRRPVDRE